MFFSVFATHIFQPKDKSIIYVASHTQLVQESQIITLRLNNTGDLILLAGLIHHSKDLPVGS